MCNIRTWFRQTSLNILFRLVSCQLWPKIRSKIRLVDQNKINTRAFTLEVFIPLNEVINSYQVNVTYLYLLETSENNFRGFSGTIVTELFISYGNRILYWNGLRLLLLKYLWTGFLSQETRLELLGTVSLSFNSFRGTLGSLFNFFDNYILLILHA